MRVVIDTNVVVSALINAHGAPARIMDLVILGQVTPVFDDRIISEYREVLSRPKFDFNQEDISALLDYFEADGESVVVPPLSGLNLPDVDDTPFIEVAAAAGCDHLITGNTGHFPKSVINIAGSGASDLVISPSAFLEKFMGAA